MAVFNLGKCRQSSAAAVAGLVGGLCSGPAGIAIGLFGQRYGESRVFAFCGLVVLPLVGLTFSIFVYWWLRSSENLSGRKLALCGIVAAVGWIVLIIIVALSILLLITHVPTV
jgi:uncharacterized BrkB/YihY/UPF0761 family membrane protein